MIDEFRPPMRLNPGEWYSTPSLEQLRARARGRAGVYADNDPYVDDWPLWANSARDDLFNELSTIWGGLKISEVAIKLNASGIYDLAPYGIIRIDKVGIGTGTDITWIPFVQSSRAFYARAVATDWASTVAFDMGGGVIGFAPVPEDTTVQIVVQGQMLPRPMITLTDTVGIRADWLNLLALRLAWYCCDYNRADAQRSSRIPGLEKEWDRGIYKAKLRLLQSTPGDAGYTTVRGVTETDSIPGARQDRAVSLVYQETILTPEPVLRLKTATVASAAGTDPVIFNLDRLWPVDVDSKEAVLVFSVDQGYIADWVLSDDRLAVTATPQAGQQWYGEDVTCVYASTGE